ncbi:DMT family transporter [Oceanibacterium hippocampi]|uniref:Riboflavin transporter n=1 Tax=Oceanibacterium hippocampi TaxID=745714 RepID=A0A1Y5RAL8_9PROT|nr:DMT family transporter [Oceanibacterium hippocampi]SLN12270.1 Riboflavin transporter [Oceanibacterium hippocampi]
MDDAESDEFAGTRGGGGRMARARVGWLALAPNVRGALWVIAAGILGSLMGMLIKLVGTRIDSAQIVFFRSAFGLVAVMPFVIRGGRRSLRTRRPVIHLVRGVLGLTGMSCLFYSLTQLPLADATALTFTKPLFLIVLAVLFLGEAVNWRRWSATAVGFLGVLIIMRPDTGIDPAVFVALAGAFLVACVAVLIKRMSATETQVSMIFYFGVIVTTLSLVPALLVWKNPTPIEFGALILTGFLGTAAQSCMIRGFTFGEATAVAPFDYGRLLYAGLIGYVVFAEIPDRWAIVGALVIVGSTLYIAYREARLGKRRVPPTIG